MKNKKITIKKETSKKTSSYHHGNLKEALLKEAVNIIDMEGIDALTLQVLSTKLGTSRSAIYRHFSSKRELIHHVFLYGFDLFDEVISPIFMQKDKSATDRFFLMGKAYIKFASQHPNLYRMLFGEKFEDVREESCDIEDEEQAKSFHSLMNLLIEGKEKKEFDFENEYYQAQVVHSMVHGLVSLYIDGHIHIKDNLDELYTTCFNTMIKGMSTK